jgi:hypothetical protein
MSSTAADLDLVHAEVNIAEELETVLRILDVYPGSRILIFVHPGSRIPDLGSKNSNKREG